LLFDCAAKNQPPLFNEETAYSLKRVFRGRGAQIECRPCQKRRMNYVSPPIEPQPPPQKKRLEEADHALSQAFRLGLADPSLLREIGNCYVATGRLDVAEDVFRKSLAADLKGGSGGDVLGKGGGSGRAGAGVAGNPHTRRCLADVLSARNSTSQVRTKRHVVSDDCN